MKRVLLLLLAILLITSTFGSISRSSLSAQSLTSSQVLADIQNSFLKLNSAERQGGNVTLLANQLTQALQLVEKGEEINQKSPSLALSYYQQAEQIVQSVNNQVSQAIEYGKAEAQSEIINLSLYLGILAALGIFTYFYLDKIFWRLWLRYHSTWLAVKRSGSRRSTTTD